METRQISLSFDKAKQWYKGTDETLKVLALQAYTKEELAPSIVYEAILNISRVKPTTCKIDCQSSRFIQTLRELAQLRDIAEYLNKGWKKTEGNTGYFITASSKANTMNRGNKGFTVVKHESVCYPLVYFRNEEDAWAVIDYFERDYLKLITAF
jgi:hypothetical protein